MRNLLLIITEFYYSLDFLNLGLSSSYSQADEYIKVHFTDIPAALSQSYQACSSQKQGKANQNKTTLKLLPLVVQQFQPP